MFKSMKIGSRVVARTSNIGLLGGTLHSAVVSEISARGNFVRVRYDENPAIEEWLNSYNVELRKD